jgi:hypothetical protein
MTLIRAPFALLVVACVASAQPAPPLYRFLHEDSGRTPGDSGTVLLGFEPGGQAYIYLVTPGDRFAHHGRWSYDRAHLLTIEFSTRNFAFKQQFPLELARDSVLMPFQVFSKRGGLSWWRRLRVPFDVSLVTSYAAGMADSALALSGDVAAHRAQQLGLALIRESRVSHTTWCDARTPVDISEGTSHDVLIRYDSGPEKRIMFDSIGAGPAVWYSGSRRQTKVVDTMATTAAAAMTHGVPSCE